MSSRENPYVRENLFSVVYWDCYESKYFLNKVTQKPGTNLGHIYAPRGSIS